MFLKCSQKKSFPVNFFLIILSSFFFLSSVRSQKLPFKSLTTADGLATNRVVQIYQDRKGFLWFATREGLSRYDGYEFVNYGVSDGLPSPDITDMKEDRQGRLWVAAWDNGVALLDEKPGTEKSKKFTKFFIAPYPANSKEEVNDINLKKENDKKRAEAFRKNKVNRMLIDSGNNIWCLTDDGVYRAPVSDNPIFSLVQSYERSITNFPSFALFEDRQGNVWFGIHNELFEARGDEIINHGSIPGYTTYLLANALQTKDGKIIILDQTNGLFEFIPSTSTWRKLADIPASFNNLVSLVEDTEGALWFGGSGGILKLSTGKLTSYPIEQGFNSNTIFSLFQDREGNLWGGSRFSGVFKLSDLSLVSYPTPGSQISLGVVENNRNLQALVCDNLEKSVWHCDAKLKNLNSNQFEYTKNIEGILPGSRSFVIYRRTDKWGIGYSEMRTYDLKNTIFRFPTGKEIDLKEFFDKPFTGGDDVSFYLDEKDSLWVGKSDGSIYRVTIDENGNRNTEKFKWNKDTYPLSMLSDRQGGLWLFTRGSRGGRLRNGIYQDFQSFESVPAGSFIVAFLDSRGWLWGGTWDQGLAVSKKPGDEIPAFDYYTKETGLLSETVLSIAEDDAGRMYFGTRNGLSRFDPATGSWNSFTAKDGLTGDFVTNVSKDSRGNIWINTTAGLTKFDPKLERKSTSPPPIYISHIKIAGEEYPLSETGITETALVSLDSAQNNLTIDFVGLQFLGENALTYQYKLEGTDADWSKPDKNRSISFANLGAGNYRFLVRAVNEDGLASVQPAAFQFKISPPIYLRWWFMALGILFVSAVAYAFYRLRLQKLLEVERTRTLIATDLHDDIGSNLSKISVLSEVVRIQLEREGKSDEKLLSSIADISRSSVSSMSDIVWAINPKRDSALELTRKMREHAEELFVPKRVSVKFSAPKKGAAIKLSMDLRRDLYLIFKEAVNNIAKHAGCTQVRIDFDIYHHEIILQIEDDGIGFDVGKQSHGNGLMNIKNRTEKLKGNLQIESEPARGTKIIVRIPQN